ncbi:MAG: RluA family pseudouridine synthase [Lachnospiraceae bacterium]|nr:RluA family pseudouridine synthase [Lachnospiraceae bacterium]
MVRVFQYSITQTESDKNIGEYLRQRGYSHHILACLKRSEDGILLNGSRARTTAPLHSGDLLSIHLEETETSEQIHPVPMDLNLLYEDEDILIVNKPADMPVHPSINNYDNTLANGVIWYYGQQNIPFVFRCINRLDRDTSGLLILAKNMLSAHILSSDMRRREIQREYLAIVQGNLEGSAVISAPIARKEGSVLERCVNPETGEAAVTRYQSLFYNSRLDLTLISLRLETGRTHQIRVHMKYIGHPLIGDYLYHPDTRLISRQALHSRLLQFIHPISQKPMEFQAPLPQDMNFIFKN